MKGTRRGEAGSVRFPLGISKIGLSLPGGGVSFCVPMSGAEEGEDAGREREQKTDRGWIGGREVGTVGLTGMGPPASTPLLGDYAGTQSSAVRRAGAPGEPGIGRMSSVESGGGVCARGLPHTVTPLPLPAPPPLLSAASHRLLSLKTPLLPPSYHIVKTVSEVPRRLI